MATSPLILMTVHAHPDDEAIATGGILAKYAAEGARTVLVTCTDGQLGEIQDPTYTPPEPGMRLTDMRMAELAEAQRILQVGAFYRLAYRDSGMAGTPGNTDPRAFAQADVREAALRLAHIIRREQPQVVVTYDEYGVYGHPDHIMANRVTQAALPAAADPAVGFDDGAAPWDPAKLYYFAIPEERLAKFRREQTASALRGTPADEITTRIDVGPYLDLKFQAIFAHRSQIAGDHLFRRLSPEQRTAMFGSEHYVCVRGCGACPSGERETDLFQGLR